VDGIFSAGSHYGCIRRWPEGLFWVISLLLCCAEVSIELGGLGSAHTLIVVCLSFLICKMGAMCFLTRWAGRVTGASPTLCQVPFNTAVYYGGAKTGTISWGQDPQGVQAAPCPTSGRKHRCSFHEGYVETMAPCLPRGGRLPRSKGVVVAAQTHPEDAVRCRGSSLVFTASLAQYRHGNDTHQSKCSSTSRAGPRDRLASPAPGPSTPSCSGCSE